MFDRSTMRVAFRTLARHKGFTTVAILSIATAIALNTVMYSVLDAIITPRINARQPELLYSLQLYGNGLWTRRIPLPLWDDALQHGMGANVEGITGSSRYSSRLRGDQPLAEHGDRYRRVTPLIVRPNYFHVLGSLPTMGRLFRESDEREGAAVAVISERLAERLFPDSPPIGETVLLDGNGFVVVGVVAATPIFQPLAHDIFILPQPTTQPLRPNLVRLKEPIANREMAAQFKLAAARLAQSFDQPTAWVSFTGKRIFEGQVPVNPFFYALVFSVAAVLLVACANLANLQLARGLARTRELALRSAVGASRGQLVRLLLLESGMLAVAGFTLGIILTMWGMKLVEASMPDAIANLILEPQTSWRVFAFAAAAALVCLFMIGLLPALTVSKVDPNEMLKAGAGTGANKEHRKRFGLMVLAQIGFALPLLIAATTLLRGSWYMSRSDRVVQMYGYDVRPMVTVNAKLTPTKEPGTFRIVRVAAIASDLVSRARIVPGVLDAAAFSYGSPVGNMVTVDGDDGVVREEMAHQWSYRKVTPNYLRTVQMPIVQGRDFVDGEMDGTGVILDAASATFLWKGANPIGRSIKFGRASSNAPWHRVIGIVGDPRSRKDVAALDYTVGYRMAGAYRVITPEDSLIAGISPPSVHMIARTRGSTELAAVRLQRQLRSTLGVLNPTAVSLLDEMGWSSMRAMQSFVSSLFSVFAFVGLSLVAIGVYGVVSHSVAQRRRELAVRISLGAKGRDILRAVLREGNVMLLGGIALGLLLTPRVTYGLYGFLPMNDAFNSPLFALIGAVLFGIAALAAYVPALRATRIDPVDALRHE